MLRYDIEKTALKERIMAVYCSDSIYVGLGRKFVNFSSQKILCIHDKCIRSISGNSEYIGCCSYDGTATIFTKHEKVKDRIEGPDTEIKGIAFYDNFIAITTRGKTTWILEDLEISKILEDHTQDVKGCTFHNKRLYTWSYDNTIKVYDLFDIDHSWELSQSVDLDDIVWSVIFFQEYMCAALQNGHLVVMKEEESLWTRCTTIRMSLTPLYCGTVISKNGCDYLCVVCNRNCLLVLDSAFNKVLEVPGLNDGCEIFSCGVYCSSVVLGSDDGTLTKITFR